MKNVLRPLWFLLAVVILFETWLWDRTVALGYWLAGLLPLAAFKRGVVALIAKLPPYVVLVVFGLPVLVIEPFKLAGIYLLTHRHIFLGVLVFIAAKLVAVAIVAFMFELCKHKLMQISWFPRFYDLIIRAWHWAHTILDPFKAWARETLEPVKRALIKVGTRARNMLSGRRNGPVAVALRALRLRIRN